MYDFNLLISCSWSMYGKAKREILKVLRTFGDENPIIKHTNAQGIIGVKTCLNSRDIIKELHKIFEKDPLALQYTLKWVPIDVWTHSDMDSMKEVVIKLRDAIRSGERWRMTVEKRRYTLYHKMDIITELAALINEKVDLKNPDKILRVDIIGRYAGISVLSPHDIFSTAKSFL